MIVLPKTITITRGYHDINDYYAFRMNNKKKLNVNTANKSGSKIPNKGGRFVAAILYSIQAKLLKKLHKNKEIILPLKGHGLVHKIMRAIDFQVEIDQNGMDIIATSFGLWNSYKKIIVFRNKSAHVKM